MPKISFCQNGTTKFLVFKKINKRRFWWKINKNIFRIPNRQIFNQKFDKNGQKQILTSNRRISHYFQIAEDEKKNTHLANDFVQECNNNLNSSQK